MTDNEKDFVKNINIDKAKNKTIICIVLTLINLASYVIPLLLGDFDFGVIFEFLTLIFLIITRYYMSNYDEDRSKKFTIFAMIPIGWLIIYDFITILSYISDVVDVAFLGLDFIWQELLTILNLIVLFLINKDLRKADNPEKYKESTDWFYEKPEDE